MKKVVFVLAIIVISFCISMWLADYTYSTDFPAFYRTAKIITDPSIPNIEIYGYHPEANPYDQPGAYIEYRYSMLVAYLIAPLAYLPYNAAKGVMIFVNILSYIGAVAITLRLLGASGRWFAYPLALSLLWPPFIQNMRFAQTNSILFLLVMAGVYFAVKNRPAICGALIGFACLFKVFPVAIALVLGLKNWRILAGCAGTIGLAPLLPGTPEWFASFLHQPFLTIHYSPVLTLLGHYGFLVFAAFVAGITALLAYRYREADYITLTALVIPAMFLTAPIVEYYHLVFIVLSLCWLLLRRSYILLVISALLILAGGWLMVAGLLSLWAIVSQQIYCLPCTTLSLAPPASYSRS